MKQVKERIREDSKSAEYSRHNNKRKRPLPKTVLSRLYTASAWSRAQTIWLERAKQISNEKERALRREIMSLMKVGGGGGSKVGVRAVSKNGLEVKEQGEK